jgi:hypothetical protein
LVFHSFWEFFGLLLRIARGVVCRWEEGGIVYKVRDRSEQNMQPRMRTEPRSSAIPTRKERNKEIDKIAERSDKAMR